MRNKFIAAAICSLAAGAAQADYTLQISNGKLPEDVRTENLNGNIPIASGYKNGWTDQGWTSGEFGSMGKVLLSPSYLGEGERCESALTLPTMEIQAGEWLYWDSRAVYPIRMESHSVELRIKGEADWTSICEATDTGAEWSQHMADLSGYAGKECEIRFVCRSENGYMLALSYIHISAPADYELYAINESPRFFGSESVEDGCVPLEVEIKNSGKAISGATIGLCADGTTVAETYREGSWQTGESVFFSLALPVELNERTDYSVTVTPDGGETLTVNESFAYLSSIKRTMLIDKGTGMWCNNCPTGTLELEELERTYGDAFITVETHNGDPLANDTYFSWLGYRSIPRFELNRIKSTSGENTKYFQDYLFLPTEMGISMTGITKNEDGTLSVAADITTAETFTASDRTYRIGYVLTLDVDGGENPRYYQSNNCAIPGYRQYYYLPSTISYTLCNFPDVSLPSPLSSTSDDISFNGIKGSLPEVLEAGKTYSSTWDIPLPTGYSDFGGMRIVAYIIDSGSRRVENSTAAYIDEYTDNGNDFLNIGHGVDGRSNVYSIDGKIVGKTTDGLEPGIYVVDGKKIKL